MVEKQSEADAVSEETTDVQVEQKPIEAPEQPKAEAPIIPQPPPENWEQKYKEIQRTLQRKDDELKRAKSNADINRIERQVSNLEEMIAQVIDAQSKEVDEYGNAKVTQSNVQKVKEERFSRTYNMSYNNIQSMLKQYGIAEDDPKLIHAKVLADKAIKTKDIDLAILAEENVRNIVVNMTPIESVEPKNNPQNLKTPDDKARYEADVQKGILEGLKRLNINPDLLKVDTYQVSQGAGSTNDEDFERGWGDGSIPPTTTNRERARKLGYL